MGREGNEDKGPTELLHLRARLLLLLEASENRDPGTLGSRRRNGASEWGTRAWEVPAGGPERQRTPTPGSEWGMEGGGRI